MPARYKNEAGPRMAFGKYHARPIASLPQDYLSWLLTIDLREPLKGHIVAEAARRALLEPKPQQRSAFDPDGPTRTSIRWDEPGERPFYPSRQRRARKVNRSVPINPYLESVRAARAA